MPTKIGISFKNRRFLRLIPTFLADETAAFSAKNRRFLREKAWNETVFSTCRFSKMRFYAMQTWQIIAFIFYLVKNRDDDFSLRYVSSLDQFGIRFFLKPALGLTPKSHAFLIKPPKNNQSLISLRI